MCETFSHGISHLTLLHRTTARFSLSFVEQSYHEPVRFWTSLSLCCNWLGKCVYRKFDAPLRHVPVELCSSYPAILPTCGHDLDYSFPAWTTQGFQGSYADPVLIVTPEEAHEAARSARDPVINHVSLRTSNKYPYFYRPSPFSPLVHFAHDARGIQDQGIRPQPCLRLVG